jgi:hypothetical protein
MKLHMGFGPSSEPGVGTVSAHCSGLCFHHSAGVSHAGAVSALGSSRLASKMP